MLGVKVVVWPCGTWCELCDLSDYSHKSDDYAVVDVPATSDASIDEFLLEGGYL